MIGIISSSILYSMKKVIAVCDWRNPHVNTFDPCLSESPPSSQGSSVLSDSDSGFLDAFKGNSSESEDEEPCDFEVFGMGYDNVLGTYIMGVPLGENGEDLYNSRGLTNREVNVK